MRSPRQRWPRRLFGFAPADVAATIATVEHTFSVQEARLAEETKALTHRLQLVEVDTARLRDRITQLRFVATNLASARRRAEATMPLLFDLAQKRAREFEAQAERERQSLKTEAEHERHRLGMMQAEFRLVLERIEALAMTRANPGDSEGPHPTVAAAPQGTGRVVHLPAHRGPDLPPVTPAPERASDLPPVAAPPERAPETAARPATVGDPAQADVAGGIRANLLRLMQGKRVGADLTSADGTVLARAGAPITPELVDQAQAAGLVTDLILDMTFAAGGGEG